jgi:hypothetical protein
MARIEPEHFVASSDVPAGEHPIGAAMKSAPVDSNRPGSAGLPGAVLANDTGVKLWNGYMPPGLSAAFYRPAK